MIVPVSSEKYTNLFASATLFLQKAKDAQGDPLFEEVAEIDSLNAYYGHMDDFWTAAETHADNYEGYRYIMMPLDAAGEEPFKVDLNTRTITVPTTFTKVGAVQADQMAELVVFSADRYFDYMDLANTIIYVQWQLPDAKGTTGATRISIVDLESEPGKIRFAWPLHNSITAHSGIIKFSVRFFVYDEATHDLAYSLNTLEANLVVKPALDTSAKPTVEDVRDLFSRAIINSEYVHAGQKPPAIPLFDFPGLDMTISSEDSFVRYAEEEENKKTLVAKLNDQGQLVLKGQAVVNDAGTISYEWRFKPDGAVNWNKENVPAPGIVSESLEKAVLPRDPKTNKPYLAASDRYFRQDGSPYMSNEVPKDKDGNYDESLYEKYTVLTIDNETEGKVTGTYAILATNTLSGPSVKPKSTWSTYCQLPAPADIQFAEPNMFTVNANKSISVNLKADKNNPTIRTIWFVDHKNASGAITGANTASVNSPGNVTMGENMAPGWYAAAVVASLNRTDKIKGTPEAQVIYANPIINSVLPKDENPAYQISKGDTKDLEIVVDVPVPNGFTADTLDVSLYRNLSYKWQYRMSNTTKWLDVTPSIIGVDDPTKLVKKFDETTGTLTVRSVDDMTAYQYRCIVTNTLGGASKTVEQDPEKIFSVY